MRVQGSMFMPEDAKSAFKRDSDGNWVSIKPTMIFGYGGIIHIEPEMTFKKGELYWGIDLVAVLEESVSGKE